MNNIAEICCGSSYDAIQAERGGAKRIELNSALFLGGLTPSLGTLIHVKKHTSLEVISMIRPRGGGFHYHPIDIETMFLDAKNQLEHGADGLAFGFLNQDKTIDKELTQRMCELIHSFQKTAVFHRAIDVTNHIDEALETLIACSCDRVLTSGGEAKAIDAIDILKRIQKIYGSKIEILVGSGVNEENATHFIKECGITQLHSSCKAYEIDPTTSSETVSYQYLDNDMFDTVDKKKVEAFTTIIHR